MFGTSVMSVACHLARGDTNLSLNSVTGAYILPSHAPLFSTSHVMRLQVSVAGLRFSKSIAKNHGTARQRTVGETGVLVIW